MYGCESWTVKKVEHRRIDAFELWCWRSPLRVPWTSRRSNQSILKENSPGCSLEGLMLKLKVQYFGHLIQRADSLEKTLMLVKIEGRRRKGWQRMRWLGSITDSMDMSLVNSRSWWWTGKPGVLQSIGSPRVKHDWATELNWTEKFQRTIEKSSKVITFSGKVIISKNRIALLCGTFPSTRRELQQHTTKHYLILCHLSFFIFILMI